MRRIIIFFCFLITAACGAPPSRTIDPAPTNIFLRYESYLQPAAEQFLYCANENSHLAIFLNPVTIDQSILPGPMVNLTFGEESGEGSSIYQIGFDSITIIINKDNPSIALSSRELTSIFSGQQTTWDINSPISIEVWTYPEGNILRNIIKQTLLNNVPFASHAKIAPQPQAMIEAISTNIGAIGFIPTSWLNGEVDDYAFKSVDTDPSLETAWIQPILAYTNQPVNEELQAVIFCIQSMNTIRP